MVSQAGALLNEYHFADMGKSKRSTPLTDPIHPIPIPRMTLRQGLSYEDDGKAIFQTTGMYGQSKVQRLNPDTFDVELSVDMGGQFFGEGSTFYRDAEGNGRLIIITWQEQTGFIYDSETLEKLREFKYTTTPPQHEGWGITYDASEQEFIVSDGSNYLYFWDRDTLVEKRKVAVTRRFDGRYQNQLNELELIDGLVCCNIWYSDEIICVDKTSGKSVREYGKPQVDCADGEFSVVA
jgi:glutamine cyclotransferase